MAQAVPVLIAAPSGQRAYGGTFPPALVTGAAAVLDIVASGSAAGQVVAPPPSPPSGFTIVRTGTNYSTLQAAITAATAGDVIESAPATYAVAGVTFTKSLTLRSSTPGQRIVLDGAGIAAAGGGTIVRFGAGTSCTLQDVHIRNNKFQYNYNSGITTGGPSGDHVLRRCLIEECSNGLLVAAADDTSTWLLENCEVRNNGEFSGLTHNLYMSHCVAVTLRGCWVHNTKIGTDYPAGEEWRESWGHLVKSRSKSLTVEACRLTGEVLNGMNRCIDYPNGGALVVRGSLLEYRTRANGGIGQAISWGVEGANTIPGANVWDGRTWSVNIRQNTIVARAQEITSASNRDALWIGVGCTTDGADSSWPNKVAVPAPDSYTVLDNVFVGWDGVTPRVNEGPSAAPSTTYAVSGASNTCGALALLTNAAAYDYSLVTPVLGGGAWAALQYQHPASTTTRADAYRGAVYAGWGTGTNAGTLVGDVWTPGRDSAGNVNAVSWALLSSSLNRWIEVADTKITSMVPAIMAATPDFRDFGVEGWPAVINSWNGAAIDDRSGSERMFLMACGGHNASSNNGVYQFALRKMKWDVLRMPTGANAMPEEYKTQTATFSVCQTSYQAYLLNPTGGSFADQLPNGDPTSRHTYGSQVFVPTLGAQGSIVMGCRRHWVYDIATNTYSVQPGGGVADPINFYTGENMECWWDEVRQRFYHSGFEAGTEYKYWWHPQTNTFGTSGPWVAWSYQATYSSTEKIGRTLWTLYFNNYPLAAQGKPLQMVATDMETGTQVGYPITLGSSFNGKTFSTSYWSDSAITFVEPLNKWLVVVRTDQDRDIFAWLDPVTWVCEIASIPGAGGNPLRSAQGRFKYFPSLQAVAWLYVRDGSEPDPIKNLRIMRVA